MKSIRLGITMRVVNAINYNEPRDAIAKDWQRFLDMTLPGVPWLPIPNIGLSVIEFAKNWDLNGLIFTGGEDIGVFPERDQTERALLNWASQEQLPVLGICRGFQLFQIENGGRLQLCSGVEHIATTHPIKISNCQLLEDGVISVNSYHQQGIARSDLATAFTPFALTLDDQWVEGCMSTNYKQFALMWHPEREKQISTLDQKILHHLFC